MKIIDKPKQRHNGRGIYQQADFMLHRMSPQAAVNAAHRNHESALGEDGQETPTSDWWAHVAITLGNLVQGDITKQQIADKAKEEAEMAQKQSKQQPTGESSDKPGRVVLPKAEADADSVRLAEVLDLIRHINRRLNEARGIMAAHAAAVTKDPFYAMENSGRAFEAAAIVQVLSIALKPLTDDNGEPKLLVGEQDPKLSVSWLRRYATDEVLRRSRSPEHSSSLTTNLMERQTLVAWSQVVDQISWHVSKSLWPEVK